MVELQRFGNGKRDLWALFGPSNPRRNTTLIQRTPEAVVEIVEVFSYILVEESLCTYGFSPACWRGVRPISTKCPVSKSTWVLLNLRRLIVTWGSIFHIRRERLLWRDKYFHPWTGRGLLGCFGVWMDYLWKWMNYLLGIRICCLFFHSGFLSGSAGRFRSIVRESLALLCASIPENGPKVCHRLVREWLLIHSILNLRLIP